MHVAAEEALQSPTNFHAGGQDAQDKSTDTSSKTGVEASPGTGREARIAIDDAPAFEVVRLGTDRRLLVNRKSQLKMYRCWMQGRFRKPVASREGWRVDPIESQTIP